MAGVVYALWVFCSVCGTGWIEYTSESYKGCAQYRDRILQASHEADGGSHGHVWWCQKMR